MKNLKFTKTRKILFFIISSIMLIFEVIFYSQIAVIVNNKFCIKKSYDDLICYYFDVDQGDAILIKLPDNKTMLIDSGNYDSASQSKFESSMQKVFRNKEKIIDYLVLTHSDSDHCGGMKYIFENFEVRNFYRPCQFLEGYENYDKSIYNEDNLVDASKNISYYETIKSSNSENGLNVIFNQKGIVIETIEYKFEFLSPSNLSYNNANDYSPIILLSYKDKNFLFCGDASIDIEEKVILSYPITKIDFIKLGHHGSKTSSSIEFLNHFSPDYAIISCKKDNKFGFPNSKILTNLQNANIEKDNILRTDKCGTIKVGISNFGETSINLASDMLPFEIKTIYIIFMNYIIIFFGCFIVFEKKKLTNKNI